MLVIPAIDLSRGRLVRLVKGREGSEIDYGDPLQWLERLLAAGAGYVHIIDIDAALGRRDNRELILEIVKLCRRAGATVQVGGGIRSYREASQLLDAGVDRVILSTLLYLDENSARRIISQYGADRVIAALDVAGGKVRVRGWKKALNRSLPDVVKYLSSIGVAYVLATNVERDGTLSGFASFYSRLFDDFQVIVAGGITSMSDLVTAACSGAYGAVVGRALLEGRISLEELEARRWSVRC